MPGDDHGSDDAANSAATNDDATDDDANDTVTDDADEYVGEYDKLVRDDIPEVVRADGNHPVTRRVDGREYQRYLAAKLREEVDELLDAFISKDAASAEHDDAVVGERDDALVGECDDALVGECDDASVGEPDDASMGERDDALLGELADVHAVLDAIGDARGDSRTAVRERARGKADARGGFADGVVLERIDPPTSRDGDAADEP
jgi:predicted house-cleaning noncanonical NTP pyrophosphatase (MazG superfamily)